MNYRLLFIISCLIVSVHSMNRKEQYMKDQSIQVTKQETDDDAEYEAAYNAGFTFAMVCTLFKEN